MSGHSPKRWQAWASGEDLGRIEQHLEDIEAVLRARGWTLQPDERARLRELEPYFALGELLRLAVTAKSFDDWRQPPPGMDGAERPRARPVRPVGRAQSARGNSAG
jgi:hypothetical protein